MYNMVTTVNPHFTVDLKAAKRIDLNSYHTHTIR